MHFHEGFERVFTEYMFYAKVLPGLFSKGVRCWFSVVSLSFLSLIYFLKRKFHMYKKLMMQVFLLSVSVSIPLDGKLIQGGCCSPAEDVEQAVAKSALESFKPDVHIKEQTQEDKNVRARMKNLFFETDFADAKEAQKRVCQKAIDAYGAKKIDLKTRDNYDIKALYFERPNAQVNIIYVTGYFHDLTPPKEWATNFVEVHPEKANILTFDWRGFGESSGSNNLMEKGSFGTNAYLDIFAVVDFVRSQNKLPIVLHGFCFGGAMVLHAVIKAQEEGRQLADAIGLSSLSTSFQQLFDNATIAEDRWGYWFLLQSGLSKAIIEYQVGDNGSPFDLKPIEMIKKITVPCWFDHSTGDQFAKLENGAAVYNAAIAPKMFTQIDFHRHVRGHTQMPLQYRLAYEQFLMQNGLILNTSEQPVIVASAA